MKRAVKFRESFQVSGVGRVDRDAATVHDVKVCGLQSANGRRYSRDALRKAAKLYEGTRVFFNHPTGDDNARRFEDRFGRLVNVRPADDGGLVADLKYNPAHPNAEQFLHFAESDPAGMGLSHNAEGRGVREQSGDVLVEEITKVHSVDIVDGPATNYSLYEQAMPDPLTDPAAPPTDGTGAGGDDIDAKLADLAKDFAAHPELSKEEKIKKLKGLLDLMHDDGEDEKQEEEYEGDDEAGEADMSDDEMQEQLGRFKSPAVKRARRKLLREQRRKQAEAKGVRPEFITDTFLEQLCDAPAAKIDRLLEDRRQVAQAAAVEKPRSGGAGGRPLTPKEIAEQLFGD